MKTSLEIHDNPMFTAPGSVGAHELLRSALRPRLPGRRLRDGGEVQDDGGQVHLGGEEGDIAPASQVEQQTASFFLLLIL